MKRILGTAVGIALIAAGTANAQQQCYDFSGLAVGTTYHIGDTVNARNATITFKSYHNDGNPVGGAANFAEVQQAQDCRRRGAGDGHENPDGSDRTDSASDARAGEAGAKHDADRRLRHLELRSER
jgi:hypothetical protein